MEVYRRNLYAESGVQHEFVQHNHSRSLHGTVRGMHFSAGQAKLVRAARGAILDVVCDIRVGSPTFGKWESVELSDENGCVFYCLGGFAHGFCVLSEVADVSLLLSSYYDVDLERAFRWN